MDEPQLKINSFWVFNEKNMYIRLIRDQSGFDGTAVNQTYKSKKDGSPELNVYSPVNVVII